MTVSFEHTTLIEADVEVVFDLALDVDAHVGSMERSRERAIGGITSGVMGLGDEVTWRAWHFRIPFTMTSRITELDRPVRFVDEQVRGPFARFRHEHLFNAVGSHVAMTDRLAFDAPAGPIGRAVERLLLGRYLRTLIVERGAYLKLRAER